MPAQYNLLDIGFAVAIALFILRGGLRGMVNELAGLIGILLGFWAARDHYTVVLPHVKKALAVSELAQKSISYAIVFALVLLAVSIMARLVRTFMSITFIGWVDHLLGCAIGAAKGVLLCSFALALLLWLVPTSTFLTDSFFAVHLEDIIKLAKNFLPKYLNASVQGMS